MLLVTMISYWSNIFWWGKRRGREKMINLVQASACWVRNTVYQVLMTWWVRVRGWERCGAREMVPLLWSVVSWGLSLISGNCDYSDLTLLLTWRLHLCYHSAKQKQIRNKNVKS